MGPELPHPNSSGNCPREVPYMQGGCPRPARVPTSSSTGDDSSASSAIRQEAAS